MTPELLFRVVSASVVPVVLLSACGLLCLAFYNRLAAIVARLRAFQQEERALLPKKEGPDTAVRKAKIAEMLDEQSAQLLYRAKLVRRTLFGLHGTMYCLIPCSLALGLGMIWAWMLYVAAPLFALGMISLFAAIVSASCELRLALNPIDLEWQFVRELGDRQRE